MGRGPGGRFARVRTGHCARGSWARLRKNVEFNAEELGQVQSQTVEPEGHSPMTNIQTMNPRHMLQHEHVSLENWELLVAQLPDPLSAHLHFTGRVWQADGTVDLSLIPLQIANAPVLLAPPTLPNIDATTPAIFPQPPDPVHPDLDCTRPLSAEHVEIAFQSYPGAEGFLVLFSGWLVVLYADETSDGATLHRRISRGPWTFGGMRIGVCRDAFQPITGVIQASGAGASTWQSSGRLTTPDPVVLKDEEMLIFRAPMHGKEPPSRHSVRKWNLEDGDLEALYYPSGSRTGRLIRKAGSDGGVWLTAATHTLATSRQAIKDAVKRGILFFPKVPIPKMLGREVYRENDDIPIGIVDSAYDDLEAIKKGRYPQGYDHDLMLIKPTRHIKIESEHRTVFRSKAEALSNPLFFNQQLKLLVTDENAMKDNRHEHNGRGLTNGITIGSALMHARATTVSALSLQKQLMDHDTGKPVAMARQTSRSILWRMHGAGTVNLQGWSGSTVVLAGDDAGDGIEESGDAAVEVDQNAGVQRGGDAAVEVVVEDSASGKGRDAKGKRKAAVLEVPEAAPVKSPLVIAGFQNFQWVPLDVSPGWKRTDTELLRDQEMDVVHRAGTGAYPFYGMYQLPKEVTEECHCIWDTDPEEV